MIIIIIAIVVVILDQLSKLWVLNVLKEVRDIGLIDGVLHFHYAENTGAAFSILEGARWFFIIMVAVVSIGLIIYALTRKHKQHVLEIISVGLILGGAIGNEIDRIRFGYVLDFIYVKIINFAIFNIADSAVVVGAILLSIYILFIHDKYMAKQKDAIEGARTEDDDIKELSEGTDETEETAAPK